MAERLVKRMQRVMATLLVGLACAFAPNVQALGVQAIPALTGHIIDTTSTLSNEDRQELEARLTALETTRGSQVVILMVATTQPEDVSSYANRVGNDWKIGRKGVGDGLLILVAKNDRKIRLEVAKSLEGAIPDLAAQQVIDTAMTPAFRQGQYAQGLLSAVQQISALIAGESLPTPDQSKASGSAALLHGFDWMDLAIFLFFAVPIGGSIARRILGAKLGSLVIGGAVGAVAWLVTTSMLVAGIAAFAAMLLTVFSGAHGGGPGRRGHTGSPGWGGGGDGWGSGGSGGDGGGFSSGGGGDFGGGGASGDW